MTDQEDICEYCSKKFSNKHNLNVHQRTAKYCLRLRTPDIDNEVRENIVANTTCEHCNKVFTSRQTLLYHIRICKKVLAFELKDTHMKQIKVIQAKHAEEVEALKTRIKQLESRTIFHLV